VLLAREVARRGVKATTANVRELMADLERKHPGDRENSLYASVELSLRRLSPESRERVKVLGVCHGGVHLFVADALLHVGPDAVMRLAAELVEVGLCEDMGYGHLRMDPGLPPYLLGEMTADEAGATCDRWAEAMAQLTDHLYEDRSKDAQLAAQLTLLELPNLLAMLEWVSGEYGRARLSQRAASSDTEPGAEGTDAPYQTSEWPPERVVELAQRVEGLVANLGRQGSSRSQFQSWQRPSDAEPLP